MGSSCFIGGGVSELTFLDSSNNKAMPAGTQAGDVAFAIGLTNDGTPPGVPSGWDHVASGAGIQVVKKVLGAGEPDIVWTINWVMVVVVRPDEEATQIDVADVSVSTSGESPSNQAVAASSRPTPNIVVGIVAKDSFTGTLSVGSSPAFDATIAAPSLTITVGYKIYNGSPADHLNNGSITAGTNRYFISFSLAVS